MKQISELLEQEYNLANSRISNLHTPTNDIYLVESLDQKYALKIYQRGIKEVMWEMDLLNHLNREDVPVVQAIESNNGFANEININSQKKACVLYKWLNGEKPKDTLNTHYNIGKLAAQIHKASDNFETQYTRESYLADYLVTEQFRRINKVTDELGMNKDVRTLADKLTQFLSKTSLDIGICHMDLKPDNIYQDGDKFTAFDFDSAVTCWRAIEPYRVLNMSKQYFQEWLRGYREIREFSKNDEDAVLIFTVLGELRNIVWHLGFAESSRGKPTKTSEDLRELIKKWTTLI